MHKFAGKKFRVIRAEIFIREEEIRVEGLRRGLISNYSADFNLVTRAEK